MVACVLLAGCVDEAMPVPAATARDRWAQAWPFLATCAGCHATRPAIDFLAPGTADGAYATIFAFQPPVIDVEAPAASLLLTMGKHSGPAFDAGGAASVLAWLQAERDERVPDMGQALRIGPFKPELGVPLTLDLGVAGATLSLTAESSTVGLYVAKLTIDAGTGLALAHPLFVSRPPSPVLDDIDRFSELDLSLDAGKQAELGPAWFVAFDPDDYVSVYFENLEAR